MLFQSSIVEYKISTAQKYESKFEREENVYRLGGISFRLYSILPLFTHLRFYSKKKC